MLTGKVPSFFRLLDPDDGGTTIPQNMSNITFTNSHGETTQKACTFQCLT